MNFDFRNEFPDDIFLKGFILFNLNRSKNYFYIEFIQNKLLLNKICEKLHFDYIFSKFNLIEINHLNTQNIHIKRLINRENGECCLMYKFYFFFLINLILFFYFIS